MKLAGSIYSAKTAADRLGIHTNTMHYRLGRIAEGAGCDLRNLDDIVDLMVAVQLVSPRTSPRLAEASAAH